MASRKNKAAAYDLIVGLGDTHCGSTTGLFSSSEMKFRHGAISPSDIQRTLHKRWIETAQEAKRELAGAGRMILVLNGDLVDGDHHDTLELVTRDEGEQAEIFLAALKEWKAAAGYNPTRDLTIVLRGTDGRNTHGHPATSDWIAKSLGAMDGVAHLRVDARIRGQLVQITHHPPVGVGGRVWTKKNAAQSWLRSYMLELSSRGKELPALIWTSHAHVPLEISETLDNGTGQQHKTQFAILPAFQGQTEYVYQRMSYKPPTGIGCGFARVYDTFVTSRLQYTELDLGQVKVREL